MFCFIKQRLWLAERVAPCGSICSAHRFPREANTKGLPMGKNRNSQSKWDFASAGIQMSFNARESELCDIFTPRWVVDDGCSPLQLNKSASRIVLFFVRKLSKTRFEFHVPDSLSGAWAERERIWNIRPSSVSKKMLRALVEQRKSFAV